MITDGGQFFIGFHLNIASYNNEGRLIIINIDCFVGRKLNNQIARRKNELVKRSPLGF